MISLKAEYQKQGYSLNKNQKSFPVTATGNRRALKTPVPYFAKSCRQSTLSWKHRIFNSGTPKVRPHKNPWLCDTVQMSAPGPDWGNLIILMSVLLRISL